MSSNQRHSSLEQSLARNGITVHIKIYKNCDVGWTLEVIDERGTSTIWQKKFLSDRDALKQALRTIDDEGIKLFVGNASDIPAVRH